MNNDENHKPCLSCSFKDKVVCPYCDEETEVTFPPAPEIGDVKKLTSKYPRTIIVDSGQRCEKCGKEIAVTRDSNNNYSVHKSEKFKKFLNNSR